MKKVGVSEEIPFDTKPELGLGLIDEVKGWSLEGRLVLADSGNGDVVEFH